MEPKKNLWNKTTGILKNEGKLAFYALIAQASQILNYGTIMAGNGRFFQDYLFNSGVIQLGKIPETLVDLKAVYHTAPFAQVRYQSKVVENYGTIRAQGLFEIQTGGTYLEHGESDFGNFSVKANIQVDPQGSIVAVQNISHNTSGTTRDIRVKGQLLADRIDFPCLSHLDVSGILQALSNAVLNVQGSVYNSGVIAARDMTLHFKSLPSSRQTGLVLAQNDLDFQHESRSRSSNAPRITENQKYRDHLIRYAPDPEGPEFRRLLDEFYRSVGYDSDRNRTDPDLKNLPATIARRIKKVTIIDYYLNTITYVRDQYGRVIDVQETGYIWQKREKIEETIIKNVSAMVDQDFMRKRALLVDLIRKQNEKLARAQEQGRRDLERRLQDRQQSFASKLARVLNDLRCSNAATRWLWNDPYFRDVSNWDNLRASRQVRWMMQRPGSSDIGNLIHDAREWIHDDIRNLSPETRFFINDFYIPLQAIHEILPDLVLTWGAWAVSLAAKAAPWFIPATAVPVAGYTAVQAANAVLPKILALARQWSAVPAATKLVTFFKGAREGRNGQPRQQNERIVDTKEGQDRFVREQVQKKKWIKTRPRNGRPTWHDPKSGRYYQTTIEKYEIEVYDRNGIHIGVIKPNDGILRRGLVVRGRKIDVK